jgi:hypothetical protein
LPNPAAAAPKKFMFIHSFARLHLPRHANKLKSKKAWACNFCCSLSRTQHAGNALLGVVGKHTFRRARAQLCEQKQATRRIHTVFLCRARTESFFFLIVALRKERDERDKIPLSAAARTGGNFCLILRPS